ncbi:permease prefix domain 1-containing protein [Leucobacter sp. NPDC058333]|uniref:permease prefix domain 1-containing protein n=1 Tax=Leucobacter sp. NPDC058333 TaxID=3346450 RepID=UPI003653A89B
MNVIIAYLDTMFSAYPQTPRLLEAKTELQGMMEDAYTSIIASGRSENEAVGQVIRDFGNLEELAPVLGITADIAPPLTHVVAGGADSAGVAGVAGLADESGRAAGVPPRGAGGYEPITLDEAQAYADAQQRIRFRVSAAIMLFVVSPATLIFLPTAAEAGVVPITESAGVFIGLLMLLALVAVGVMLFLSTSREMKPHERIAEGKFAANPLATHWANALAEQYERRRIRALQVAIALWILSPMPLIAFGLFMGDDPEGSIWSVIGVVIVLVIVAAGLGVLLPQAWAHTVAERISSGKDSSRGGASGSADDERSIVSVIAAFYWPLLTAIFLAWSFIGDAWSRSWIVWPVGGVLFAAIAAGSGAVERYRRTPR